MHLALARIPRRATWAGDSTAPKGRDMEQAHPRSRHREELGNCHSQTRYPKVLSHVQPIRLAQSRKTPAGEGVTAQRRSRGYVEGWAVVPCSHSTGFSNKTMESTQT